MTFQRGTSGNPRGRPKRGAALSEFLRAELDKPYRRGERVTKKERIAQVVVEEACKGNLQAVAWLTERTEGKISERLDLSGTLSHEHSDRLTDQERAERLVALFALFRQDAGRPDHGGDPLALVAPGGPPDAGVPE